MTVSSLVVVERTRSPHVLGNDPVPTIHARTHTHGDDPTQRRHRRTRVPRSLSNDLLSPPLVSRACNPLIVRASELFAREDLLNYLYQKEKEKIEKMSNYEIYLKGFGAHMFRYI